MTNPEAITKTVDQEEATQEITADGIEEIINAAEPSVLELPYILGKNSEKIYILSEEILSRQGCFVKVKRYLKGRYPELGTLVHPKDSWSESWETIQITTYIIPFKTFFANS
jgi:hypothetical protein